MDREEEERILRTAQAQEWARRNAHLYEPRWSRACTLAFLAAVLMACGACWIGWTEMIK